MNQITILIIGVFSLTLGSILGYYTRQSLAKKRAGTIEQILQKKISQAKDEASKIVGRAREDVRKRREELYKMEKVLLKRESILQQKITETEKKEDELQKNITNIKGAKEEVEKLREDILKNLEQISGLTKEQAKEELIKGVERDYQKDILDKIKKLEAEGQDRFEKKAKELLATAIQRCAIGQAQELTTTIFSLPTEKIKGKIIGKEGRNIRTLERLTGVEIIIDETPETLIISAFDPIRRQIAKASLEKLISDGRIQPARIEEKVKEAETEINSQIKEAGETAVYDIGVIGLDPKLIQLLGRLKFRTSYGQNVLLHSIEVAHLAGTLASELGADVSVSKKAGLLHDIGKAVDSYIEGSHTDIGIKILEKFGSEKEVIDAMKSHHEEYPFSTLEGIIVKVADQISGARPGARRESIESYLKRLSDLEDIALSFPGVEKAYAIQAGREIRIFVKPEEIDDIGAKRLARQIVNRIEEELKYPGEIKVTLIRELKVEELAR